MRATLWVRALVVTLAVLLASTGAAAEYILGPKVTGGPDGNASDGNASVLPKEQSVTDRAGYDAAAIDLAVLMVDVAGGVALLMTLSGGGGGGLVLYGTHSLVLQSLKCPALPAHEVEASYPFIVHPLRNLFASTPEHVVLANGAAFAVLFAVVEAVAAVLQACGKGAAKRAGNDKAEMFRCLLRYPGSLVCASVGFLPGTVYMAVACLQGGAYAAGVVGVAVVAAWYGFVLWWFALGEGRAKPMNVAGRNAMGRYLCGRSEWVSVSGTYHTRYGALYIDYRKTPAARGRYIALESTPCVALALLAASMRSVDACPARLAVTAAAAGVATLALLLAQVHAAPVRTHISAAAAAAAAAGLSCAAAGLERTAVDVLAVGAAGCLCLLSLYECAHRMHKACSAPVRFVDARLWKAPAAVEEDVENSDELLQTKLGDSLRSGLAASDALAAPVTPGGTSRGGTSRGSLAERRRLPSHPPRLRTDSITVDSFCATLQGAPAADESASGGSRRDASYATPTLQEGSFRWADANPLRGKQKDASGRLHPPSARGTPSKATPLLSVAGAAPDGSFNSVLDGNTALALPVRDKCVRNNSSSDPEGLKGPRGSPHLLRSGAVRRSALSVVGRPEDEVPKFAGTASFASPPASPPRRATIAINATNAVAAAGGLVDAPKTPLVERRQRTLVGFSPHPNADTATVSPPIPVRTDSGGPLLGYPEKPLLSASIAMQRPRAKPEDSSAAASSSRRLVGPLLPDSPTFPTATSPPDNLSALSSPKYGRQLRGRSDAALALALSGRGSAAFAGSPVSQFSASSPTDEHCSASMMQTTSNLGTTRRVSGDSVPMAATPPAVDAALPLGPLASPRGRKQALVNAAALEMIPDLGATLRKISQAPSSLSASSPRGADSAASSPRRRAPDACTGGSVLASPRTSLRSLRGLGKTSSAKAIVSGALAPTAL